MTICARSWATFSCRRSFTRSWPARCPDGFDIEDVAAGIADKLVARHPHVFAEAEAPEDLHGVWEQRKAIEKQRSSALDGIPEQLSALSRASKIIGRARSHRVPLELPTEEIAADDLGAQIVDLVARAQAARNRRRAGRARRRPRPGGGRQHRRAAPSGRTSQHWVGISRLYRVPPGRRLHDLRSPPRSVAPGGEARRRHVGLLGNDGFRRKRFLTGSSVRGSMRWCSDPDNNRTLPPKERGWFPPWSPCARHHPQAGVPLPERGARSPAIAGADPPVVQGCVIRHVVRNAAVDGEFCCSSRHVAGNGTWGS